MKINMKNTIEKVGKREDAARRRTMAFAKARLDDAKFYLTPPNDDVPKAIDQIEGALKLLHEVRGIKKSAKSS